MAGNSDGEAKSVWLQVELTKAMTASSAEGKNVAKLVEKLAGRHKCDVSSLRKRHEKVHGCNDDILFCLYSETSACSWRVLPSQLPFNR